MAASSFTQSSFLGGEWSPLAQGKINAKEYPTGMNVCRNGYPVEEGAWIRRSGTRLGGPTFGGSPGRIITFDFEEVTPYYLEFTDGLLRAWASAPQSSGLVTSLPTDFRIVTTNDNQQIVGVSTANPAVIKTASAHGWSTNDQVAFLFDQSVPSNYIPLLRTRLFRIIVVDTTHFSIADAMTGASIDGTTLGWSLAVIPIVAARVLAISTPYTSTKWATIRKVQAEKEAILLQGSLVPRNLQVTSDPSSTAFATFSLSAVALLDGPYLDPPTDGSFLTPTITPVSQGVMTSDAWSGVAWNGTVFCAVASGGTDAATSPDGVTWTARTLPSSANWSAIAWNGTVFCAISSGSTHAATSADGITWNARTLPSSANWSAISWSAGLSLFVIVATGGTSAASSADGITWVARTLPTSQSWCGVAWNGTVFLAINGDCVGSIPSGTLFSFVFATSTNGTSWTSRAFSIVGPGGTLALPAFSSLAWNGTVFCIVGKGYLETATTPDGINYSSNQNMPSFAYSCIAWNGSIFCAPAIGSSVAATSADGVTWIQQALPLSGNWSAIAAGGDIFCIVANVGSISLATTFANFFFTASFKTSINGGIGFQSTDVGRSIRFLSEPLAWFTGTAYTTGQAAKFNGAYYIALGSTTGNQPDISPTKWAISTAAATWTWGIIQSITSTSIVTVSINGPALLYTTNPIAIWRLGVYSDTTGYPTCGTYYEGRLWLSGAVPNRADASQPNDLFNMAPTEADGTVTDASAISYTFNSDSVNPIFWMIGQAAGILAGTQAGEWLIASPTAGPITATNIHAFQMTHYGSANVEPESTQLTVSFVQRFNRTILECFPDALSGKYTAPNLTENGKHLTVTGIEEIRYQQELLPIIWARMGDGSLAGATYERDSLFSSQPAKFIGWHRHDFANGNTVESIAVGPSADGTVDTLAMVQNEGGVRHVEFMQTIFKIGDTIQEGWFVDDALVPTGGVIYGKTLTLYGLWYLNGQTCAVTVGGVDMGDLAIANGSVVVPIDDDPDNLLTTAYLQSISASTYGAMAVPIDGSAERLTVPAVVGFSFTSQGQTLRPDTVEQSRSQLGPAPGKPRRLHQFSALLNATQGISFGTDFSNLIAAQFRTKGGTDYTAIQLFSGVYQGTLNDDSSMDGMMCWQISRPYPACLPSLTGYMQTQER